MKITIARLARFLLILFLALVQVSCQILGANIPEQTSFSPQQGIVFYDLDFEIDPAAGVFRAEAAVTVTGNLAEGNSLIIYLGEQLVIDQISLENERGNELPITGWEIVDTYTIDTWWGISPFSEIQIRARDPIPTSERRVVKLQYHLPEEGIQEGLAENMYALFVSPEGIQAGGPESGAFPLVGSSLSAPFSITIHHPHSWQCALPGERISREIAGDTTVVNYQSDFPYDPSFSCADYKIMEEKSRGLQVELFAPSELDLSPQMIGTAIQILRKYQDLVGQPAADSFRVVFPEIDGIGGGESNGNLVLLGDVQPFLHFSESEEAQGIYTDLIAHEGYHLWNAWSLNWEGTLAEWWVEGGATFMAAWMKETLFGAQGGAENRLRYLEEYIEQGAYLHGNSLASLDATWFEDWALVYDYGALVWEQLRQKIGEDALWDGLEDFYAIYKNQDVNYYDFILCLENYTDVDLRDYLSQWTKHNAQIDLILKDVEIREVGESYEVEVSLEIDSDGDYEIFTALGYKTSPEEEWQLLALHFEKSGVYKVKFLSRQKPTIIQFDPEYRVPQINLEDDLWSEG